MIALPDRVPCPAKLLHDGHPCGNCNVCRKATSSYAVQWQLQERPPQPERRLIAYSVSPPKIAGGPGTELTKIIRRAGFSESFIKECDRGCTPMARKMDRFGPVWCLSHLHEISELIYGNYLRLTPWQQFRSGLLIVVRETRLAYQMSKRRTNLDRVHDLVMEAIHRGARYGEMNE